jgi:hypothetical protein
VVVVVKIRPVSAFWQLLMPRLVRLGRAPAAAAVAAVAAVVVVVVVKEVATADWIS